MKEYNPVLRAIYLPTPLCGPDHLISSGYARIGIVALRRSCGLYDRKPRF